VYDNQRPVLRRGRLIRAGLVLSVLRADIAMMLLGGLITLVVQRKLASEAD
jgi:hypothetical protein